MGLPGIEENRVSLDQFAQTSFRPKPLLKSGCQESTLLCRNVTQQKVAAEVGLLLQGWDDVLEKIIKESIEGIIGIVLTEEFFNFN